MSRSQLVGFAVLVSVLVLAVTTVYLKARVPGPGIVVQEQSKRPRTENADETALNGASRIHAVPHHDPLDAIGGAEQTGKDASPHDSATSPDSKIVVQVAGAVKSPGVYRLNIGSRNDDAVKAAGGVTSDANAASVNLAARAVDGSQLYIKTRKEQPEGGVADEGSSGHSTSAHLATAPASHTPLRSASKSSHSAGAGRSAKLSDPSQGRININTASTDELQKIRGIGPSLAARILNYRTENHGFHSLEDLMQVSGVGVKTYEKLAPYFKLQ